MATTITGGGGGVAAAPTITGGGGGVAAAITGVGVGVIARFFAFFCCVCACVGDRKGVVVGAGGFTTMCSAFRFIFPPEWGRISDVVVGGVVLTQVFALRAAYASMLVKSNVWPVFFFPPLPRLAIF